MRSVISVIMTAALLLSALSACARGSAGTVETRVTPKPNVTATARPAATEAPDKTDRGDTAGGRIGDAARDAGDAMGDMVEGVGDAVNDVTNGVDSALSGTDTAKKR